MGRKPTGRKYPKHISIQVKEEHNKDLKRYCAFLNEKAPLDSGQWTIRDVILTMLYSNWERNPNWMVEHHFEKLGPKDLEILRKKLGRVEGEEKVERLEEEKHKDKPKGKLKLSLNNSFTSFIAQLDEITGE